MAVPHNAARAFVDEAVKRGDGGRIAFCDPAREITYGELQVETNRAANLLISLGLRAERRVALLLEDTVDFPVLFWGALRAGVVPVCLNTLLTAGDYAYILADCRAEALVVSASLLEVIEPVLDGLADLSHVVVSGGGAGRGEVEGGAGGAGGKGGTRGGGSEGGKGSDGGRYPALAPLLRRQPADFETAATVADDVAFWLYSSGSTGRPKAVLHLQSSPAFVARNYGRGVLDIRRDDVCFAAPKLFFAYGMGAAMILPMSVGAKTILRAGRVTPDLVFEVFAKESPTLFFGVPTLYRALLVDPRSTEAGPLRPRLCVSAGEALPSALARRWRDTVGAEIIDGVGNTEMLHAFVSTRPGAGGDGHGDGGAAVAVPGYRLKLVDEAGREVAGEVAGDVAGGAPAELWVSGGSMAAGYWNQREKSRRTFVGEWLRTGDLFTRDAAGGYRYCGRADDMFKVAGRWVSPVEVEDALTAHRAVAEAAVVAHREADGFIIPRAFVVLVDGEPADDVLCARLQAHVKAKAGVWKYPRRIEFVDALPKTATGKIQRFRLRARP